MSIWDFGSICQCSHQKETEAAVPKETSHELTAANKQARLECCRHLLKRYPSSTVNFIWFMDEKIFTVTAPSSMQNDRVYMVTGVHTKDVVPERLLCTRPTFSHSVMASVGVLALGHTNLHFVDPGVKINKRYYRDTLLIRDLLPGIKQSLPDYFTLQQDGTPLHRF